jgi:hypothetical protein
MEAAHAALPARLKRVLQRVPSSSTVPRAHDVKQPMKMPIPPVALVTILVVGCGRGQTPIPAGAQVVHVFATESEVRLEPATVHAGDVYLVLDEPLTAPSPSSSGNGARLRLLVRSMMPTWSDSRGAIRRGPRSAVSASDAMRRSGRKTAARWVIAGMSGRFPSSLGSTRFSGLAGASRRLRPAWIRPPTRPVSALHRR